MDDGKNGLCKEVAFVYRKDVLSASYFEIASQAERPLSLDYLFALFTMSLLIIQARDVPDIVVVRPEIEYHFDSIYALSAFATS